MGQYIAQQKVVIVTDLLYVGVARLMLAVYVLFDTNEFHYIKVWTVFWPYCMHGHSKQHTTCSHKWTANARVQCVTAVQSHPISAAAGVAGTGFVAGSAELWWNPPSSIGWWFCWCSSIHSQYHLNIITSPTGSQRSRVRNSQQPLTETLLAPLNVDTKMNKAWVWLYFDGPF